MLIELWRRVLASDYSTTTCAVCGNDFDRGSVFPVVFGDQGQELGEMCPTCLEYLSRRRDDPERPTLENWPARDWPTVEDLEEARRRYPEPMFADAGAYEAGCNYSPEREDELLQSSFIRRMKPEKVRR